MELLDLEDLEFSFKMGRLAFLLFGAFWFFLLKPYTCSIFGLMVGWLALPFLDLESDRLLLRSSFCSIETFVSKINIKVITTFNSSKSNFA